MKINCLKKKFSYVTRELRLWKPRLNRWKAVLPTLRHLKTHLTIYSLAKLTLNVLFGQMKSFMEFAVAAPPRAARQTPYQIRQIVPSGAEKINTQKNIYRYNLL